MGQRFLWCGPKWARKFYIVARNGPAVIAHVPAPFALFPIPVRPFPFVASALVFLANLIGEGCPVLSIQRRAFGVFATVD